MGNIRRVTSEELRNNSYPLCRRCEHYSNNYSTIFGDACSCNLKENAAMVDDNRYVIEVRKEDLIYDCGLYTVGEPNITVLG